MSYMCVSLCFVHCVFKNARIEQCGRVHGQQETSFWRGKPYIAAGFLTGFAICGLPDLQSTCMHG